MNFLVENEVSQEPSKRRITVQGKYFIEETPSRFIYPNSFASSKMVKISRVAPLLPQDCLEIELPQELPPNSKIIVDSTDQANKNKNWLCQEVDAVNRSVKIKNTTKMPIILGKNQDTSIIKIRPVVTLASQGSLIKSKYNKENKNVENFRRNETTLEFIKRINVHQSPHLTPENVPDDYLKKYIH